MPEYEWRYGTHLKAKGDKAEDIVKALREIEIKFGTLNPATVVECAKDSNSILHKYFTWDDTEAARKYREQEARYLLSATVYIVKRKPSEFDVNYRSIIHTGNEYKSTLTVITDPALRKIYVNEAKAELLNFKKKYAALQALIKYVDQMLEVLDEIEEEETEKVN